MTTTGAHWGNADEFHLMMTMTMRTRRGERRTKQEERFQAVAGGERRG